MSQIIFINYRREEAQSAAGRLHDQLEQAFGRERIFFDVDSIMPGKDFVEELSSRVAECDIFLAVVGRGWIDVKDFKGGRRIDNPTDWVRIEIESALEQKKHVIPVLVDGADMPRPENLPESLTSFARKNAVRLTHDRFRSDVQGLVAAINKLREAWAREEAETLRRRAEQEEVARREGAKAEAQRKANEALQEKQNAKRVEAERKALTARREEEERMRLAESEAATLAAEEELAEAYAPRAREELRRPAEAEARGGDDERPEARESAPDLSMPLQPETLSATRPARFRTPATLAVIVTIVLVVTGGGLWMMAPENATRPSLSQTEHDRHVAKGDPETANRQEPKPDQSASPMTTNEPSSGSSTPEDRSLPKQGLMDAVPPGIERSQKLAETPSGWLGVRIQNVDDAIAKTLDLGFTRGALVAGVDDNGPLKRAGVKAGDVIVKYDGKPIKEARDLQELVATTSVGRDVELVIMRDGKEETKQVQFGRLEQGEKFAPRDGGEEKSKLAGGLASQRALGLELSRITDELRTRYRINDHVQSGVVITSVDPHSDGAEKRLQAGELLAEVNQEPVSDPVDAVKKIKALKDAGKKNVLLVIANGRGDAHYVALPLEGPEQAQPTSETPVSVEKAIAGETKPERLQSYGDWDVYVHDGKDKICYAMGVPKDRQPKAKLQDPAVFMFISTRPAERVMNEVAISLGYQTKDGSAAMAKIDGEEFALVTRGTHAWVKNATEEPKFVKALKAGSKLIVKASSAKGMPTTDTYSLKGLSSALDSVQQECN